jgi:hypothetical protein
VLNRGSITFYGVYTPTTGKIRAYYQKSKKKQLAYRLVFSPNDSSSPLDPFFYLNLLL